MSSVDVIKCCLDSITQISDEIKDAIVYLDAGCTESFQILGAYSQLLELGARSICSLENMTTLDQVANWNLKPGPAKKVVFFTSRPLTDTHRYVMRCLSMFQTIRHCSIMTSVSEMSHSAFPDSPLGPDAYREYELLLVQDYEELVKKSDNNNIIKDDLPDFAALLTAKVSPKDNSVNVDPILTVSVHHFPMIICPLSPRVFVLPSEGSISEAYLSSEHESSISVGLPPLNTGVPLSDTEDVPLGATLSAQFLYHFASKMDLKLEIFSLGDFSKNVGKLLMDMSSLYDVGRRKKTAGLLIIDRTLDLLTPCCHGDSLLDRIFTVLPRKERIKKTQNSSDFINRASLNVQIPLEKNKESLNFQEKIESALRGWKLNDTDSKITEITKLSEEVKTFNGTFVSSDNFHGTKYLEALLERNTRDGLLLIKKWLQESLRRENISLNSKIRAGPASNSEVLLMIKALAKSESSLLKNKGIIQLGTAVLYALDESKSSIWDAFNSAEKILNVNSGDNTSQSLAAQISDLINKSALVNSKEEKSKGLLSLEDTLLLMVIGYILAGENFPSSGSGGPFSWQEEHFMKEAIVDAIIENPGVSRLKFLQGLSEELEKNKKKPEEKKENENENENIEFDDEWGNWGDEETEKEEIYGDMQLKLELRDRVDTLFKFLHKLSSLKRNISSREDDSYSSKGLIYKVLTRVLNKYDVPGLEYHSSAVGRLFKSGFGRFGLGQAKPSLGDQNVILVFVIGGINGVEVREAQEAISESGKPETELILGGTTLLTPNDMLELILGDYSYVKSV